MRWSVKFIRRRLIGAAMLAAAVLAAYLYSHQQPTKLGVPLTDPDRGSDAYTYLSLSFKEFRPAGNQFSGSITVDIAPNLDRLKSEGLQKWTEAHKKAVLRLNHYDGHSLTWQGGTDEPVALSFPPAWGALRGTDTFTWSAEPERGAFFYPFDRYNLHVNPSLMEVSDPAIYPSLSIDTLSADFTNSNLVPQLHNLEAKYPDDRYSISLERPILLRFLAVIVGGLLVLWLGYLLWSSKAGEQAGQLVSLFAGVFAIRSSLLSGAPLFPSLIDYCALAIYLSAVLIVLLKWVLPDRKPEPCPWCQSPISSKAKVCPQCTRDLTQPVA